MRISLIFLLLPCCLGAQNMPVYNTANIPSELLENASAVVRTREITFKVKAADEAVLHEKRVVTVLSEASSSDHLVLLYDGFSKIGKIKGRVYDAAGQFIRDLEKNEINDRSFISDFSIYEDSRVRYIDVNHDKFPFTVVFEYDIAYSALRGYPNWDIQDFNTAVEQSEFTLDMPSDLTFRHKSLNIDLTPIERTEGRRRLYSWSVHHLKAVKKEPYAPPAMELLPVVLVSPDLFKAEDYVGSISSWQSFGAFQYELAKGRDVLSPALREKVKALTANAASEGEKIAILYRFMQENTRYVSVQLGIGGWQPFDAQYVEKNKYGDCKALSNFMKALLLEAGITAYPALVKYGDDYLDLPDDFATPYAFNHVILYVPSQDMWLECTSNYLPPAYLGSGTDDRKVLLITEAGGRLSRTPSMPASDNSAHRHIEVNLLGDGGASIGVHAAFDGALHEWYRYAGEYYSPEELQKEMQKKSPLSQSYFAKLDVHAAKEKPEVALDYVVDVPQFGSKAGKRFFIPLNPISAFSDVPAANDNRVHPVWVTDGYMEQDTIVLHFPENYAVESIPATNTTLNSAFGSYSAQIVQQDQTLTVVRYLEIKPARLPASRYTEWRNFRRDVAKADGMKVVLVGKN